MSILFGCYFAGPAVDERLGIQSLEYSVFQFLTSNSGSLKPPAEVRIILIGDDSYWLGELAGRRPLNRTYLAGLLHQLAPSRATTIGVDFDLRSPDPRQPAISPSYQVETDTLMHEIGEIARTHKVVLTKTLWTDPRSGDYVGDADVYQAYGICSAQNANGSWSNPGTSAAPLAAPAQANLSCGYAALPFDMRVVPGQVALASGHALPSFALATAMAVNRPAAAAAQDMNLGSNLPLAYWQKANAIVDASSVRSLLTANPRLFDGKIILIGAGWHSLAWHRGDLADMHSTPVGDLAGTVVNGNFIEAILQKRTYRPSADWMPEACELLFGILAALAFSLEHSPGTKVLALLGVSTAFLVVQWLLLAGFGMFFEALVPILGLWLHSMVERLIGEKDEKPSDGQ